MKLEHYKFSELPESAKFHGPDAQEIKMGESRVSQRYLVADGIGPCIGLAGHNDATKTGLLGHFASVGNIHNKNSDRDSFIRAVAALDTLGDPRQTDVYLFGASPHYDDGLDVSEEDRMYAAYTLTDFGWSPKIDWSPEGIGVELRLNNPESTLQVVSYTEADLERSTSILDAIRAHIQETKN